MTDQPITQSEYILQAIRNGEAWEPSRGWLSDTHVGRLSNEREGRGLERFNRLVREGREFIARAFSQDESPLDPAKLGGIQRYIGLEDTQAFVPYIDATSISDGFGVDGNLTLTIRLGDKWLTPYSSAFAHRLATELEEVTGVSFKFLQAEKGEMYYLQSSPLAPGDFNKLLDGITNANAQQAEQGNPLSRSRERAREDGGWSEEIAYRLRQAADLIRS